MNNKNMRRNSQLNWPIIKAMFEHRKAYEDAAVREKIALDTMISLAAQTTTSKKQPPHLTAAIQRYRQMYPQHRNPNEPLTFPVSEYLPTLSDKCTIQVMAEPTLSTPLPEDRQHHIVLVKMRDDHYTISIKVRGFVVRSVISNPADIISIWPDF